MSDDEKNIKPQLWNNPEHKETTWYSGELKLDEDSFRYQQTLLQHYVAYLETAEATSERRLKTNAFFLTINTAIIGAIAYVLAQNINQSVSLFAALASGAGIATAFVWHTLLSYMKGVNSAKFKVIEQLESQMLAKPMSDGEWGKLEDAQKWNWETFKKWVSEKAFREETRSAIWYSSLAKEEKRIPWIVGIVYGCLLAFGIVLTVKPEWAPHNEFEVAPLNISLSSQDSTPFPLSVDAAQSGNIKLDVNKLNMDPLDLNLKDATGAISIQTPIKIELSDVLRIAPQFQGDNLLPHGLRIADAVIEKTTNGFELQIRVIGSGTQAPAGDVKTK